VSPDTLAHVVATVVIGIIAVAGTIYGAKVGAKQGADATLAATQEAINADRDAARQMRAHEDYAAIRALASECRLNADVLTERRDYAPDPRLLSPLRYIAFDQATTAIASLPTDVQQMAHAVLKDVLWFNRLVAARLVGMREEGDAVARALILELEKLANNLPPQLNAIATQLDAANARAAVGDQASPTVQR
jgi:hypothetical protein